MPRRTLNESLERLRSELARAHSLPDAERARLESLLAEVSRAAEGEAEDEEESLADRLHEFTERFEEEHPKLTLAVGAVADSLSRLGI